MWLKFGTADSGVHMIISQPVPFFYGTGKVHRCCTFILLLYAKKLEKLFITILFYNALIASTVALFSVRGEIGKKEIEEGVRFSRFLYV